MSNLKTQAARFFIACTAILSFSAATYAAAPTSKDLDAAITSGDFGGYYANLTTWLNQKLPAKPADISEASMKALLGDAEFVTALDQRQLISQCSPTGIGQFAKAGEGQQKFLAWLLKNSAAMDLYLEGGGANSGQRCLPSLKLWKEILEADADSKEGIYLRLAIATALYPPPAKSYGSGVAIVPVDRYKHFKTAHQNHELFPTFDTLTVWEYGKIVSSWASDSDMAWARQMLNTWRPDLRNKQQVVNVVSEVWRRSSPFPYSAGFVTVMEGGGKCGPRSWFGAMICQAFGMPAQAMGQPAHSAVAVMSADPAGEPQPGRVWKMCYGRDWQFTHDGSGFLKEVDARNHVAEYSQAEHLRWLASATEPKGQVAALNGVAVQILPPSKEAFPGIHPVAAVNAQPADKSAAGNSATGNPEQPVAARPGVMHLEAASFSKMSGVSVHDCFTGGKQVNFGKSIESSWVDYPIDVPAAGEYELVLKVATPNREQKFAVGTDATKLATVNIPNTHGLWGTTDPVSIKLNKGPATLRISAPFQRGVAVRWLELKSK
ncbi:MAG: carbohydrate-binding protein [Planctomycetia bacterium]|nr:carbohydrate-binding protein [Planctomycetia bacterium]